ncbi:MAG: MJ0042-type zinc finger domain-containing protein [Akkermansiaceae bacterium]
MRIQCPECSQRFDVTEDFLGKTVECGSCDGRFKVSMDEIVAEKKKFYPGEKRDSHLERFGRNTPDATEVQFKQAQYKPDIDPGMIGPPRPRRTLAMVSGLLLMLLIVVIFLLAGGKEGAMRDMVTQNRFILCGFTALVGSCLVMYGSVNRKPKGIMISLIGSLALLSMPVLFPGNPTQASVVDLPQSSDTATSPNTPNSTGSPAGIDEYLFEIGYDPVENALRANPKEGVVAVFVRNASPQLRRSIGAYLYESTDKKSRETSYDRGENDSMGLILLVNQTMTIEEIAALCTKFGRIEKISKDLRVVDVMVENSKLAKLDQYKVLDPESLDFETQNLKALDSIDPKVKMDAVKRLASAEPRARRDDITQKLIKMLPESNTELQLEIIRALKTWALPGAGAEKPVLEAAKKIHNEGKMSQDAMDFLIKFEVDEAGELLLELWEKDPVAWSETMISLGSGAQVLLLPKLKEMDASRITSASAILGKTATEPAILHIEEVMTEKEGQAKKSLQAAIDEIKRRS